MKEAVATLREVLQRPLSLLSLVYNFYRVEVGGTEFTGGGVGRSERTTSIEH